MGQGNREFKTAQIWIMLVNREIKTAQKFPGLQYLQAIITTRSQMMAFLYDDEKKSFDILILLQKFAFTAVLQKDKHFFQEIK